MLETSQWVLGPGKQLPLSRCDVHDRCLAATAYELELTLVTTDERLLGRGEIPTLSPADSEAAKFLLSFEITVNKISG